MSDSLTVAIFGASAAAIGYVAKLLIQTLNEWKDRRAERTARLVELQSLLLAAGSVFFTQIKLAKRLSKSIQDNMEVNQDGYDELFATTFLKNQLTADQKASHGLIRAYTMNAILPLNRQMMAWLQADRHFKAAHDELGTDLRKLEAHLVMWMAKYDLWIPGNPERTLVFLADELDQGVAFPSGIEELVIRRTGGIRN